MSKRIHVVVNPAAGQAEPILNTLNSVWRDAAIAWDVSITHQQGDAAEQTRQAVEAGVDIVAAYGGDGTVMEVANGLMDSEVPLAILPGGTGNVLSVELGIPQDLAQAAQLVSNEESRPQPVDVGQCGEQAFLLRVAAGFSAEQIQMTSRELRDRYGKLAYFIAGLQALPSAQMVRYEFTLDGQHEEFEGTTCLIANAGSIGVQGFSLVREISIRDGLLDLIAIRSFDLDAVSSAAASIAGMAADSEGFRHWQAREITIACQPSQPVVVDGEDWGQTPCTVQVLPEALAVLVPS
jgi:YegS/Rv2252/BmrU family lipid kinase